MSSFTMMEKDKRMDPEDLLKYVRKDDDIIVAMANGEPVRLIDELEANASRLSNVHIHQMHARKTRPYINGEYNGHLNHVSYFLSEATRKAYRQGTIELVPNHFHEVPRLMHERTRHDLVLASATPMDEHGYFSLGTNAEYITSFIGDGTPFILEVRKDLPRTIGQNQLHVSQVKGFIESDATNYIVPSPEPTDLDEKIASHIVDHIHNGYTIQIGIGGVPNAIMEALKSYRHLGIHTEMLTNGIVDLVKSGAVDGSLKQTYPGKIVGTFALGSAKLYDFIHQNPAISMLPVNVVNDPRLIAQENYMISINSATEVDFYGECASETIQGKYYSSTGGQSDFARGVALSNYGVGFICLHSTAKNGAISRIRPQLTKGSAVTTSKNDVHYVVTEYGAVNLKGKSIRERTKALISIAHPNFRDELTAEAKQLGYI